VDHTCLQLHRRPSDIIEVMGSGPDKDEPGRDPAVSYGRACLYPVSELVARPRNGPASAAPARDTAGRSRKVPCAGPHARLFDLQGCKG
jgi:hypothetical protein